MNLFFQLADAGKPVLEKLFAVASDIDIYSTLCEDDELEIGNPICCPLRLDDTSPSFCLFIPTKHDNIRKDEVWWIDFKGDTGNVFEFVRRYAKLHYDETLSNMQEIVLFLDNVMGLGIYTEAETKFKRREIDYEKAKKSKVLLYTGMAFNNFDLQWWAERCIDLPLLKEHNVKRVRYLLDEYHQVKYRFKPDELAYALHVLKELKIYCPNSKDFKWRSTCTTKHIFGAEQCKGSKDLIITKSLKDIMTFKSFMNIDVIAPQGEGNKMEQVLVDFLKKRYRNIYAVMDYDPAGISAAERLAEHGFITIFVDTKQEMIGSKMKVRDKDISDYAFNNGPEATLQRLKEMFPDIDKGVFREDRPETLKKLINEYKEKSKNSSDTGHELNSILY